MRILIQDIRTSQSLSQSELADKIGITRPYLSQLERGDRRLTVELKAKLAEVLGVSESALIDKGGHGTDSENLILTAFRSLEPSQQDVWVDMARAALRR